MPGTHRVIIGGLAACCFLILFGTAVVTADPPHAGTGYENIFCNSCHMLHNALGSSLTNNASNSNLCMSCHTTGAQAANWPFSSSDQATPGTSGTSHRWDRSMAAGVAPLSLGVGNPNNPYGLRTSGELKTPAFITYMQVFNGVISCSVCHAQHSGASTPFDPYSYNASNGDPGGAATGGSSSTLSDTAKATWTLNQWATYTVVITGSANASNIGATRTILSNTAAPGSTLTVSSNFPAPIQAGDTYYITKNGAPGDYGTASGGSTTTVVDASKTAWTANQWQGYYVKMTSGPNAGMRRRIVSNSPANTLTTDAFPGSNGSGNTYYITSNRHLMRENNVMNEMCMDCHYYRTPASVPAGGASQTDVRTWDGNRKSHPVGKVFTNANGETRTVGDPTQYNTAPLEPSASGWSAQSGARYQNNGGSDTNLTNNITVGIDGKVTCLSCHGIHYTDSNSTTVDTPSGYAP